MIIDRIEGDFAVCELENREMVNIEISKLPKGIYEGAVISENENGYFIDKEKEEEIKKAIEQKMKRLFK